MDQPGPSQPPPSSSITDNPVVAVGRKVKAALSSHQQPSVRIIRGSPNGGPRRRVPLSKGTAEKLAPELPSYTTAQGPGSSGQPVGQNAGQNTFSNRFAGARNRAGSTIRSLFGSQENLAPDEQDYYDQDTVDLMDVVDPEVATLSTLTNVQNSLFVPSLGKYVNRRPTYTLSERPRDARTIDRLTASLKNLARSGEDGDEAGTELKVQSPPQPPRLPARTGTIISTLSNSPYAILPNGETLQGWTPEEIAELNDIVRHQLHSRRAKLKRSLKGFSQYVRRPLGLFITVYATLVTLFGLAWVLFLIGWISLGAKQSYVINIVDNVLVALFAIIGDGLAPFRAVDTYHMIYIAYYHRKTWKKRQQLGLPKLADRNDLPDQRKEDVEPHDIDLEGLIARRIPRGLARRIAPRMPKRFARMIITRSSTNDASYEYTVLTDEQQAKLEFHERKFSKSHTFYKPHETETHFAFPLKLLVAVVVLLDCHSALQISLGACTWGIPYKQRPFALTTVILCFSITCNIMGGVLISMGDKKTRKKDVIDRMIRQELTGEAIEQMETRWIKEAEERGEVDKSVRKKIKEKKDEEENEEIKQSWKVVPSLPKTLLGKGVDHRQPSLPQSSRTSKTNLAPSAYTSATSKSKSSSNAALPTVQEQPALPQRPTPALPQRPNPALRRADEQANEGTGQKVMRLLRRADMDKS